MNNFIYDMFVASKLFAVIYRLYYHKFKVEFKSDISKFETFVKQASINFGGSNTSIAASNNVVNIKNLFDISNLNLNTSNPSYKNDIYCGNDLNMPGEVYDELLNDIGSNIPIPLYHNASDNYNKFESTGVFSMDSSPP